MVMDILVTSLTYEHLSVEMISLKALACFNNLQIS